MKLEKIVLDKKYDILTNVKNAFVLQAISYAKVYELLHKQIWRKVPSRVWTYAIPHISTFNGRPVTFIRGWNIKSYSTAPYSYSGGDHTFGLNQLFMEQDYRKEYIGNPKDGIYHDDCYITPKMQNIPAGEVECWGYWTQASWDDPKSYSYVFRRQDANGNILVNNVSYSTYSVTTEIPPKVEGEEPTQETNTYRKLTVYYASGSTSTIELGELDEFTPSEGVDFGYTYVIAGTLESWEQMPDFSGHGSLLFEQSIPNNSLWNFTAQSKDGWIRAYADGTVIEYVPLAIYGDMDNYYSTPAHIKILPMMYTDTGDLAMDRVEFVEKWNDYFELVVHEDSEWWQSFIKPISAIITIVVAIYTGIIFNPIGAIGTALSVVGTLSGNRTLGLIGGIMMLGAGMYEMGLEGYANQLYEGGAVGTQADVIGEATFGKAFEGLQNIGLENLAKIGSKIYSITNDIKMLGMEMPTMEATVEDESGMRATMKNESEEDLFAELYKMIGV